MTLEEMVPFECSERHRLPPLPSRMVLPVTREAPPRPMATPAIWLAKMRLSTTEPWSGLGLGLGLGLARSG